MTDDQEKGRTFGNVFGLTEERANNDKRMKRKKEKKKKERENQMKEEVAA